MGRRFRGWWGGTKPTDIGALAVTLASLAIAGLALAKADQATRDQAAFQERSEEEQSAPILAPGTPPADRGHTIKVATEYASVTKRADRLFLDRTAGRLVVPVRNAGTGIALTVGLPVIVDDCDQEPRVLPSGAIGPLLGTYVLPSGASDQLGYLQPTRNSRFMAVPVNGGFVQVGRRRLGYSVTYRDFGGTQPANLLIWYTDAAQHLLRWTCTTYTRTNTIAATSEWAVTDQRYGSRPWPSRPPVSSG